MSNLKFGAMEMERVALEKVVEGMRHPPVLYWGVLSAAAALCWGTSAALSKRGKRGKRGKQGKQRSRSRVNPGIAFKRLRRKYAEKLRPLLEDLVYLTMTILNNLIGIIYWILDCCLEGRPTRYRNYFLIRNAVSRNFDPNFSVMDGPVLRAQEEEELYKPRRGAIMRLRTRMVKLNSLRGRRQACGCWGWVVDDLVTNRDVTMVRSDATNNFQESSRSEKNRISDSAEMVTGLDTKEEYRKDAENYDRGAGKDPPEGNEGEVNHQPRWSECHCAECAMLLMPLSVAVGKLYVRSEERPHGEQGCKNLKDREDTGAVSMGSNDAAPALVHSLAGNTLPKLLAESACAPVYDAANKDRTAVIFIHGLFSSSTFWFDTDIVANLSDAVKRQHRILAPDLLGTGRSPRPVDSLYTLADHIEAIESSVIRKYKLDSFHLVGHSMGSIVSLVLAARCPERVRSITLIAPVYPPGCLREDGQLAQLPCDAFFSSLNPLTLKGVRALTVCKYYNISRLLGHLFYSKHTFWVSVVHNLVKRYPRSFINDYITNYHDAAWHITHNTLLAGTHAVIPALRKLQDSGHRILVIHGENDSTIQLRLAEEMSQTFSNVELVAVPGKGHVDVVWGRAMENTLLIEKAILEGDNQWFVSS